MLFVLQVRVVVILEGWGHEESSFFEGKKLLSSDLALEIGKKNDIQHVVGSCQV